MPTDRLLVTLLRSLQTYTPHQDTPRLLGTASSLFTTLSNPHNLTLLTSQLLSAPAVWTKPDGLRLCHRFVGVFQASAMAILRREEQEQDQQFWDRNRRPELSKEEWVKALLQGANEQSPRWRHVLVMAGILIGFEGQGREGMPWRLRSMVESALVKAINLALETITSEEDIAARGLVFSLNYSFQLLSEVERSRISYDYLLPVLIGSAFFSDEGYRSGYFFSAIDNDLQQVSNTKFSWPEDSTSFQQMSDMSTRPLVTTMGPLSRLIAHTVENVQDSWLVQAMMDDLQSFASTVFLQWRRNKISEVDPSEELIFFDEGSLQTTIPLLWRMLRSALFTMAIILRGVLGRVLNDGRLAADTGEFEITSELLSPSRTKSPLVAPEIATQALQILRNLHFVSSRLGTTSLSQYTFVYLTCVDILSSYPNYVSSFLESIRSNTLGQIPQHPIDRNLDLFFLNLAENVALVCPPQLSEDLLIATATPYLASGGNNNLLEIFEAAHSVMLAVLSSPQSADLAVKHLPFYVDTLFKVFPRNLSSRQFRLAFTTLIKISTPPSSLSVSNPDLAETLLEMLHRRAGVMPSAPRPTPYTVANNDQTTMDPPAAQEPPVRKTIAPQTQTFDERTTVTLTIIDALPFLPIHLLEHWLPLTAELLPKIDSEDNRLTCRERFWEVLSSGEMDVERSRLCVAWWSTMGGQEMVLYAGENLDNTANMGERYEMAGALMPSSSDHGESKL